MHEWQHEDVKMILHTCFIIHNMIVTLIEEGQVTEDESQMDIDTVSITRNLASTVNLQSFERIAQLIDIDEQVRCKQSHYMLRSALEDHLWNIDGIQEQ